MSKEVAIETPKDRSDDLVAALSQVWEASVRATHAFLTEVDIVGLRPEVCFALKTVEALEVARLDGVPCGFSGVQDGVLEMLFIAPEVRGCGVGSMLVARAVQQYGVTKVDVNEQNSQAVGFYEHEGFVVSSRSDGDDAGRPFPLLHMRLTGASELR